LGYGFATRYSPMRTAISISPWTAPIDPSRTPAARLVNDRGPGDGVFISVPILGNLCPEAGAIDVTPPRSED
jgi:hypothetical protein